jgi:hypothetical protein
MQREETPEFTIDIATSRELMHIKDIDWATLRPPTDIAPPNRAIIKLPPCGF